MVFQFPYTGIQILLSLDRWRMLEMENCWTMLYDNRLQSPSVHRAPSLHLAVSVFRLPHSVSTRSMGGKTTMFPPKLNLGCAV